MKAPPASAMLAAGSPASQTIASAPKRHTVLKAGLPLIWGEDEGT